jgi:hypothetical protein
MKNIKELIERDILRLERLNLESNINKLVDLDNEIHRYLDIFNDTELERLKLNREDLLASSKTILKSMLNSFKEIWNLLSHNKVEDKLRKLEQRMQKLKNSKDQRMDPRYANIVQDGTDLSIKHLIENDNAFINSLKNLNTLTSLSTGTKNKYYWTKDTEEIAIELDKNKGDIFVGIDTKPYIINSSGGNILELLQKELKYTTDFPTQKLIFILPDFSKENSIYVGGYGYSEANGKIEHLLAADRIEASFIQTLPKAFNNVKGILDLTETFIKKKDNILKIDLKYRATVKGVIDTLTLWLNNRKRIEDDEYQSKYDRVKIIDKFGKHLNTHNVIDTYIRYLNQQIDGTEFLDNNQEWESMRHY